MRNGEALRAELRERIQINWRIGFHAGRRAGAYSVGIAGLAYFFLHGSVGVTIDEMRVGVPDNDTGERSCIGVLPCGGIEVRAMV